jgi:hypothetical protein
MNVDLLTEEANNYLHHELPMANLTITSNPELGSITIRTAVLISTSERVSMQLLLEDPHANVLSAIIDRQVEGFKYEAARVAKLPAVENRECWLPERAGAIPGTDGTGLVEFDQLSDGTAVIKAEFLQRLLVRAGYGFNHSLPRTAGARPGTNAHHGGR